MGNAGLAFLLMPALAAFAFVTPFFLLLVSHLYVTTLTYSSGGDDRFRWPRESYQEWFGQGAVVCGVLFIWSLLALLPTAVLLLIVPPAWAAAVWCSVMWLAVPISLCSVMMAPSRLLFLYPPLIGRLFRQGAGLLYVYLITLPLFAVAGAGAWLLVVGNPLGIVAFSVAFPFALLLHGRAWGRLAWLALNFDRKPRSKKRKRKSKPAGPALDVPLETADADDGHAYGLNASLTPTGEKLATMSEYYAEQQEYERKLRIREGDPNPDIFAAPQVPTFQIALRTKVFDFIFDSQTLGVCANLCLVCLAEMALIYLVAGTALQMFG